MKFQSDFFKFLGFLKNKENFAFVRFSDGEAIVMQDKKLILASNHVQVGSNMLNFGYPEEDHKEFDPQKHGFVRDKLIESYTFKKHKPQALLNKGFTQELSQPQLDDANIEVTKSSVSLDRPIPKGDYIKNLLE